MQLKVVHTAPRLHRPNKLFSVTAWTGCMTAHVVWDWAADCSILSSCGGKGPVFKTAARPTDNECSSVGRTQLSDTGVDDELTVVGQVTRGVAWQGPVDEGCNLEHDALPHRKPVQLAKHRRDMIASPGSRHDVGCYIWYSQEGTGRDLSRSFCDGCIAYVNHQFI